MNGRPDESRDRAAVAELPAGVLAAQLPWTGAWDRVRARAGMPGVDSLSVSRFARTTPAALRALEGRLAAGEYRPLPLRLAEMHKKHGGHRLLLVPSVADRVAQTAVAQWLGARWDAEFDRASFAYRPGRGVHAALRYLRQLHHTGFRWVLDADIQACFDSIEHDRLFERLTAWLGPSSPLLAWLRSWVTAPVWDGSDLWRLVCGIPQGSPLSPLLANFFLDAFDRRLRAAGVTFIRYADDFLVLARTPFDLAAARRVVDDALARTGLRLNPDKTRTTTFDRWFRFLGAEIQGGAILLPFEKTKHPLKPVFVAPAMPPALVSAWREGRLVAGRPFVWVPRQHRDTTTASALPSVLARLAGGSRASLRRRP